MILITGYQGFIGKHVVNRMNNNDLILIEKINCYNQLVKTPWREITEIWHMGAISDTTCNHIPELFKFNVDFTLALFDLAIKHEIPVKFASSAAIYGMSPQDNRIINPLNQYAFTKAIVDKWIELNMQRFKKIQSYRFFNVYGKHEHEKYKKGQASPVYTFTQQAITTGVVKIFNNSDKFFRDFVWVEDVIDCMLINNPSGFYDVGTSNPVSFEQVAKLISKKYNATVEYLPFPKHLEKQYQTYTCAERHFVDQKFTTVEEYLSLPGVL